ncbi:MAG: efflux transporter, family, subunit [Proteobacteria bacterium]|nr:efflux transporter, family, subunit [Pseudomonadota bacterium]
MQPIHHPQHRLAIVMALAGSFVSILAAATASSAEVPTPPASRQTSPASQQAPAPAASAPTPAPAARAVVLVTPKVEMWPDQIEANGDIMPWQETRIGTEIGGLRLVSVQVNVGDVVKKGQVLAQLNPASIEAELDAVSAQLMESQATLAQAEATLSRAKRLAPSGGVSQQELTLYETQKQTATARFNASQAQVKAQQLKLESATLVAPDDGLISARSASEGAIVQAGSELFRLIRQGRLEWRAEVPGETLMKLAIGQEVTVTSPLGTEVKGRVRQVSPTIDLKTRTGLVYVDLPADTDFKAGLHVSGTLALKRKALVLPASAVRHGAQGDQVFTVNTANRIEAVKVTLGRVIDEQTEIIAGLDRHARVVARDVETLKNGDAVTLPDATEKPKVTQDAASVKKPQV